MKAEWINPFIKAAEDIFEAYGMVFRTGRPSIHPAPFLGNDVNVAIGITGDIKGQVILSLGTADALGVAQNVIPWELVEFDEMASSSISELTNILAGRAASNFEQEGITIDLSVPSIITGSKIKVYSAGLQNIIVPFALYENKSEANYSGFFSVSMQRQ